MGCQLLLDQNSFVIKTPSPPPPSQGEEQDSDQFRLFLTMK